MKNTVHSWLQQAGLARALALAVGLGLLALCPTTVQAAVSLISVSPVNNATGVATNTPVVFAFSGPIDTDTYTAVFLGGQEAVATDDAWNAENTVLTVTPAEGWPDNTTVEWTFFAFTPPADLLQKSGHFTTGSGGPGDTTPPTLSSSSPATAATAVPINSPISFVFSEAMQPAHSINWSANLTPAKFAYSWSTDGRTLTCLYSENLPANASITWSLNPSGPAALFADVAGNRLAANVSGGFVTSDTVDPCIGEPDDGTGAFNLIRQVDYDQTGSGAPVEGTPLPSFSALLNSPTNNPVTAAELLPPTGSPLTLSNFFGSTFMSSENYASQAQLDAARPPGTSYTLRVTRTTGGQRSVTLSPTGDWPPIPQIQNLQALQTADATSDIVIRWNGFTGAGARDFVQISIGNNFYAPDLCSTPPRPLANTATQITVPAGTLATNEIYEATLTYTHVSGVDTNTIPDLPVFLTFSKSVRFEINTGSSTPGTTPQITSAVLLPNGHLELQLSGSAGKSYTIESSSTVTGPLWTPVHTAVLPASGALTYDAGPAGSGTRFFRAKAD